MYGNSQIIQKKHCKIHIQPDLAPNDFFVLLNVKQKIRRKLFSSPQESAEAYENHVLKTLTSEWRKCFGIHFEHLQKCVKP